MLPIHDQLGWEIPGFQFGSMAARSERCLYSISGQRKSSRSVVRGRKVHA